MTQGKLDADPARNPYYYSEGIFAGSGEFTVGAVSLPSKTTDPRFEAGSQIGCWYNGLIGGLAIFNRALTEEEMQHLSF